MYFHLFCGTVTLLQLQRYTDAKIKFSSHFNVVFRKPSLFQVICINYKLMQQIIFTICLFILATFEVSSVCFSNKVFVLKTDINKHIIASLISLIFSMMSSFLF